MLAALMLAAPAAPAGAQLGLPGGLDPLGAIDRARASVSGSVSGTAQDVVDRSLSGVSTIVGDTRQLAQDRLGRLRDFVAARHDRVDWDDRHEPARAGELLLLDPDAQGLAQAAGKGFALIEQGEIADLGIAYARLATPAGLPLARAIADLRRALPGREITADQLHFPSGAAAPGTGRDTGANAAAVKLPKGGTVGVIDGGIAGSDRLAAQGAFAAGAPKASDHASAIASLLKGAGTARIYGADVYGADPAGGNALAIARALGWMAAQRVPVVSISLVGPANPLLARSVAAARAKGMVVVGAVGNDGAAAPPAYPASYPGVVAVTGVDGRGRVLIEAGKAAHLDYAAPGADMTALVPGKGRTGLRGTSFAAPLAAARIAARMGAGRDVAAALKATDGEALSPSRRTGRGVLCMVCRTGG
ncbi:S8 family serine peptidase [Novosphingobium sp. ZW T3_23]|uniref:S8 family serine peptidase n=1 Tax=Novosphingobium sp. ZW T3_23 TaxID=3378084 RepID=UPI0038535060